MRALHGVRVLDFTTLLPGPLATLILAEAGAEVIKIERPGMGDEARTYAPRFGPDDDTSVNFALLNRGKRSVAIDLKQPGAVERMRPLIESAQVLIEQFRPGVMDRLGLGYDDARAINPRLVYCSITGYGQDGPKSDLAGHDLNYMADTGILGLAAGADGAPVVPPVLVADIGAGSLPAVINVLLALRNAEATGEGCKIDIAMTDSLFAWGFWAMGMVEATGQRPKPGAERVTGGTPRYRVYATADGRFMAAAPLEQRFWDQFCDAIGLADEYRDDGPDPDATARAVAAIIGAQTAEHWRGVFEGRDVCCNVVRRIDEALADSHHRGRGLFDAAVVDGAARLTAVPVPVDPAFRDAPGDKPYPRLGADNDMLEGPD